MFTKYVAVAILFSIVGVFSAEEYDLNTMIRNTLLEQQRTIMETMLKTRSINTRATDLAKCDDELANKNDADRAIYMSAMAACRLTYDNELARVDGKYSNARTDATNRFTNVCGSLSSCIAKDNSEFFACVSNNVSYFEI